MSHTRCLCARDVTDARRELGIRTDKSWAVSDGILTLRLNRAI
jgi:hypothetical protein